MLPDPNDPNDVLPRLERAADVIMRRRGSAKERLARAYTDHLVFLMPDGFPVEHQPALEELRQAMNSAPYIEPKPATTNTAIRAPSAHIGTVMTLEPRTRKSTDDDARGR